MDRNWHAMMLLWTNYIYKYRIIRGTIGNYKPPPGYTEKDYVLHGQLATIYNDVRQLKSVVDRDGTHLTENTDNDLYTRIFLGNEATEVKECKWDITVNNYSNCTNGAHTWCSCA